MLLWVHLERIFPLVCFICCFAFFIFLTLVITFSLIFCCMIYILAFNFFFFITTFVLLFFFLILSVESDGFFLDR